MVEMHIQNVGGCAFRKVEKCNGSTKTLSTLLHGFYFFSNMKDPNCWLHHLLFERFDGFKCFLRNEKHDASYGTMHFPFPFALGGILSLIIG
jgi:hypothetical protein